jgi:hypothetical protein
MKDKRPKVTGSSRSTDTRRPDEASGGDRSIEDLTDAELDDMEKALAPELKPGLYRRVATWLIEHTGSPHAIALGFAIGVFVALTPTVGIQMVLGATIAHIFRANRVVAAGLAWITNPLTIVPIYYFNYRVGLVFLPGDESRGKAFIEALSDISFLDPHSIATGFRLMAQEFAGIAGVLWLGSLIVAVICGVISYPIVRRIVEVERALATRRNERRARHLAARDERIRRRKAKKKAKALHRKQESTKDDSRRHSKKKTDPTEPTDQ